MDESKLASVQVAVPEEAAAQASSREAWQAATAVEIAAFSEWFAQPGVGGGALIPYEKEMLRGYLWWKLKVQAVEAKDAAASPSDQ